MIMPQAEVDSACATVSLENINIRDQITIFPNPANKELFISNNNGAIINEVNIYNQIGQKVFQETQITNTFDVSMLRRGAYIIELISNEFIIREKLIIE